jgi:hypothetical protein
MRRTLFIIMVLFVGTALGFAVAGLPRRSLDRPLSSRPAVTTTIDPTAPGVDGSSSGNEATTTTVGQ